MTRLVAGALLCLACGVACAQPPEPPPEAVEGDYTLERADSVAAGEVEVVVGAAGAGGARARGSRRVSFRGGGASGTIREGDDALAGGRVAAPFARGTLIAGRLAPRWGQGLLLGGAADPWARTALDRGARARFRGRAGEGLAFESDAGAWVAGRFDGSALVAVRGRRGPYGAGVVAARAQAQWLASLTESDRRLLAPWLQHDPVLFDAGGCERCQGGYAGRLGVFQVLPISDAVQALLFAQADRQALAAQAARESVRTLRQSAWAKALQGLTSVREVLAYTSP